MIDQIFDACARIIQEKRDVWQLAFITDQSYEDGRNRDYLRAIESYAEIGIDDSQSTELRKGIQGWMAPFLTELGFERERSTTVGKVDFVKDATFLEVKMCYDLTLPKYYTHSTHHSFVHDQQRLRELARTIPNATGYQAIFFIALPNFDYPKGVWYRRIGKAKAGDQYSRSEFRRQSAVKSGGLREQFSQASKVLDQFSSRPQNEPFTLRLSDVSDETKSLMVKWFDYVFEPCTSWKFDPDFHLRDAQVGVAVWEYRSAAIPHYELDDLLAGMTPDQFHPEIDTGPPVGKEIW